MTIRSLPYRGLRAIARLIRGRDGHERFFSLPHAERVRIIKESYSHETKTKALGDYFRRSKDDRRRDLQTNFRPYFDYVAGYASVLKPKVVMQLGAFLASEAQLLAEEGFEGRVIASDYDAKHLDWLRNGFKGSVLEKIEYRCVDLESPKVEDFADVDMVAGIAVLSNIQPEGMERFMATVAASSVRCVLIGDMYDRSSLGISPENTRSVPLKSAQNWAHPYQALGRKHGFDTHFFPDFTYAAYVDARGIFVLTKDVGRATHEAALAAAWRRYLDRHDAIWSSYA